MSVQLNKLTNANVYSEGNSLLGKVEEAELPVIVQKMTAHNALGMLGDIQLPSGIEAMESKFKWASVYPDAMRQFANPFTSLQLQVRGNLETYTSQGRVAEVPYVVFMTATCKDLPLGNFKKHENVEIESNLNVTYCRLEIDGEPIVEFDAMANIYKVDGVDVALNYRNNTGA
jgi:hypothetical protein